MEKKSQFIKNDKTIFYITYTIVLAMVLFNYKSVVSAIQYIFSLATPLYIAIIIAFVLNIPLKKIESLLSNKIEKKSKLRGISILITLAIVFIILGLFASFIIPKIGESLTIIFTNIYNYTSTFVTTINDILAKMHIDYTVDAATIQNAITGLDVDSLLTTSGSKLGSASINILIQSLGLFNLFLNTLTSFIMSIYLLANKEAHIRQLKKIVAYFLGYKKSAVVFDISSEANHYFNGFIYGQLLECIILIIAMYIGFRITNIPFPELIAVIIGIASFVPMFGGFAGFGIGFILILAVDAKMALVFTLCFTIIYQFESNVIYPRIMGGVVGISGLYVLLGLVIFGNLFGFFGLLIAVPSMALIYAVGSRLVNLSLYRRGIEVTSTYIKQVDPVEK